MSIHMSSSYNLFWNNDIISSPICLCILNSWVHCTISVAPDLSLLKVLIPFANTNLKLRESEKGSMHSQEEMADLLRTSTTQHVWCPAFTEYQNHLQSFGKMLRPHSKDPDSGGLGSDQDMYRSKYFWSWFHAEYVSLNYCVWNLCLVLCCYWHMSFYIIMPVL